MSVVDLSARRASENEPDADCVQLDDAGRPMQLFALDYRMDDGGWALQVWAYSLDDAEARVWAMRRSLSVVGQVVRRSA